jgi:hypothetical protein
MTAIWNNFQDTAGGGKTYNTDVHALIAYNVLNGNAAGAGIEIGGHDEHASHNNRQEQEQSSFQIGALVGRILATANLLNSKVMVQITQDGSVVCNGGTPTDKFNDDDNQGNCVGGSIVFMFNPTGPIQTMGGAQIGGIVKSTNLNQNARVDANYFTSNVRMAQAAIFYNYLVFKGQEAKFDQILPNTLSVQQKTMIRRIV